MNSNSYFCLSQNNSYAFPSSRELKAVSEAGLKPLIFPDSCVCLHIIRMIDHGKNAKNVDFKKIVSLKEFISRNKVDMNMLFGMMELCMKDEEIDFEKLWDFRCRLDFFRVISTKRLKTFNYDFKRDFFGDSTKKFSLDVPEDTLLQSIGNIYCALLKLRSIAMKGLSKSAAVNNILTFRNWMIDELDLFMGVEDKLAMSIFGGKTEFRKMLAIDETGPNIRKKLRGTCWDIFHAKNASNDFRLFEKFRKNIHGIFVTSDYNLYKLFRDLDLKMIKEGEGEIADAFVFLTEFDYPHFDKAFTDYNNKKILDIMLERIDHKYEFNSNKLSNCIHQLERENLI